MVLLDEHFSYRTAKRLREVYPGAKHVSDCGLLGASDDRLWDRCISEGLALVTQDYDFFHWSLVREPKPKIVYLSGGPANRQTVEEVLIDKAPLILSYLSSDEFECIRIKL